jgi:hypothetical protein
MMRGVQLRLSFAHNGDSKSALQLHSLSASLSVTVGTTGMVPWYPACDLKKQPPAATTTLGPRPNARHGSPSVDLAPSSWS